MKGSPLYIAPEAEKTIAALPERLREKVKNALRDISRDAEQGAALGGADARRMYRAGRFRIFYRRENGSVWIDALNLDADMHLWEPEEGRAP